jgi:PAS domain S-box-containing protein
VDVIAAAGHAELVAPFVFDPFLEGVWNDTQLRMHERVLETDSVQVLEVAHPFFYRSEPIGVIRLGLSMEPLETINQRVFRRLSLITVVILAAGFIVLIVIVGRQNQDLLTRQFQAVETFSNQVIAHVGDGILVFDEAERIVLVNLAAQELLGVAESEVLGTSVGALLASDACTEFLHSSAVRDQVTCDLPRGTVHLLMAKSTFEDENGRPTTVLILRDLTRLKQLESEVQQRERMQMMGEVASGFAHEIRNPLNAIGVIVQQLRKDFTPTEDTEAYDELTGIVHGEVRRIDEAVSGFLRTVRPEPLRAELFSLSELFSTLQTEYGAMAADRRIELSVDYEWKGDVQWDLTQMHQVLMNLVQNAFDAMPGGGALRVSVTQPVRDQVQIDVSDSGEGMTEDVRSRIFSLYFTTKAEGTGIGLAMVQRIVQDHGGTISVESQPGIGTTFSLRIPQWYTKRTEA